MHLLRLENYKELSSEYKKILKAIDDRFSKIVMLLNTGNKIFNILKIPLNKLEWFFSKNSNGFYEITDECKKFINDNKNNEEYKNLEFLEFILKYGD